MIIIYYNVVFDHFILKILLLDIISIVLFKNIQLNIYYKNDDCDELFRSLVNLNFPSIRSIISQHIKKSRQDCLNKSYASFPLN